MKGGFKVHIEVVPDKSGSVSDEFWSGFFNSAQGCFAKLRSKNLSQQWWSELFASENALPDAPDLSGTTSTCLFNSTPQRNSDVKIFSHHGPRWTTNLFATSGDEVTCPQIPPYKVFLSAVREVDQQPRMSFLGFGINLTWKQRILCIFLFFWKSNKLEFSGIRR